MKRPLWPVTNTQAHVEIMMTMSLVAGLVRGSYSEHAVGRFIGSRISILEFEGQNKDSIIGPHAV